jgi:hypothetical protein
MADRPPSVCSGPFDPLCNTAGELVGEVAGTAGDVATNAVLGGLGAAFVSAADSVVETSLAALDATTGVNLTAAWFRDNLGVMTAVTLPVVVGLFVLQVITSVVRREPGGLARAGVGAAKATIGAVLAIGVTQAALLATDGICQAIAHAAGTTIEDAARRFLQLTWLASPAASPALQMLLGLAVIVGSILLWGVLLFRKAAILLVAVFAPVAFAGSVWDHTRIWVRRWIEVVAALVLSKIVIVVVFVLGASAFGRPVAEAGGSAASVAGSLSDLLVGLLLLSIAVLSPWLTFKFVHWSGIEAGTALQGSLAAGGLPGAVRTTGTQAKFLATQAALSTALGAVRGGMRAGAGARPTAPTVPPPPQPGPSAAGGGSSAAGGRV